MFYLSDILNSPIRDRQGTAMARVQDVVVRLPDPEGAGEAVPRLHGLVARTGRGGPGFFVPVSRLGRLRPGAVELAQPTVALETFERRPREWLLAKDVWDRRVIDCATRRVRRVNDLLLGVRGETDPALAPAEGYPAAAVVLLGAEIGVQGILRRLGLFRPLAGVLGARLGPVFLPWNQMDLVLSSGTGPASTVPAHPHLAGLHPVEIAHLTENVSTREAAELIAALDDTVAADVMEELPADRQIDIVEFLPDARAADILEEMAPDDASDLLGDLPDKRTAALLEQMEPEAVTPVRTLLAYPDTTAGGMMTTSYVHARPDETVATAIKRLRPQLEKPDMVYYVYVLDDEPSRRLVGIVSLRELLLAQPSDVLRDFMHTDFLSVSPDEPDREVARKLAEYNLVAIPVLDDEGGVLGIVTVDDALDVLLPSGWQRRLPRIFS
jgi:CBS domain-containing protein